MIPYLPLINAILNGLSSILLIVAYVLIRNRKYKAHGITMISAFVVSSLFLIGYLAHKFFGQELTTEMLHLPNGWLKYTYLMILIPHVILAMVMLPLILMVFHRAYRRRWDLHRKLAKPTLAIWLYVSITGVVIYLMLYHLLPAYVASLKAA